MRSTAIIVFCSALIFAGCGKSASDASTATSDTPTAAYTRLYNAVKSRNVDAIKNEMTKQTQSFAESVAARQKKPVDEVFENGFTATTFSATLPEIRDERVSGNMGAVEVFNSSASKWEDLPFMLEDGRWKLAMGELFSGKYKSPGKGRAQKEAEAANAAGNNVTIIRPNANIPGITVPANNASAKPQANAK